MSTEFQTRTKTCPACAEEIKTAAAVCRFCNFDFQIGMRSQTAVPTKTSGKAIASLILGILFIYGIGSILALVLGHWALNEIDASDGTLTGRGMAMAGVILGYIGLVLSLIFWVGIAML